MDTHAVFLIVGIILIILVPIVPKMVQVRIAVLKWLRLTWLADIHEKKARGIVLAVQVIMIAAGTYLIGYSIGG